MTDRAPTSAPYPEAITGSEEDSRRRSGSQRSMRICGATVFAAVVVLLSFLLPPMFRDADGPTASGGAGVHGPPTSQQAPPPAGAHTPPAGGHAPPNGAP